MSFNCVVCDRSFDTQRGLNVNSKRAHRIDNTAELSMPAKTINTVEPMSSIPSMSIADSQDNTIDKCVEYAFIWGQQ